MAEEKVHAFLSASSAHRWMNCTPSVCFESKYPDPGNSSPYAQEGTKAHAAAEELLKEFLQTGIIIPPDTGDREMDEAVRFYTDTVLEKVTEARKASPDSQILIEQRLDFSDWVPEGFGTGDAIIVSDGGLEVCDLKYGKGVKVSAIGNPQMRLYALGAVAEFGMLYGFDKVRATIIQPRLDHVESEELTVKELLQWGEEIKAKAKEAFLGKGKFNPGEHCRFCKGKLHCRQYKKYITDAIRTEFPENELKEEEIVEAVLRSKEIKSWLDEVEKFALAKALNGEKLPGLKLVRGRSVRKITDQEAAAEALRAGGFEDVFRPKELKTITDLEKLAGKKKLAELLDGLIEKPEGKPTLVPVSDKRPEIIIDMKSEFNDEVL